MANAVLLGFVGSSAFQVSRAPATVMADSSLPAGLAFANTCSNPLSVLPGQSGCASPQFVYLGWAFPEATVRWTHSQTAPEGNRFGARATRSLESLTWGFSVVMHRRYHIPPRAACRC